MKFKVTLKDPDGFYEGIEQAARESMKGMKYLSQKEEDESFSTRHELLCEDIKTWVEYGEYIEIEFDTDAKKATVVPLK